MGDVASRYISKGGRTASYGKKEWTEDLMCTAEFLVWAEDEFFAGYTGAEAFIAFCRLVDIDPIKLRKIMKGEA